MDITKKRPLELSADEDEVPLPKSPNQEQPQQRLDGKSSTHLQAKSLSKAAKKLVALATKMSGRRHILRFTAQILSCMPKFWEAVSDSQRFLDYERSD